MIRKALAKDIPEMMRMARAAHDALPFPLEFSEDMTRQVIAGALVSDGVLALVLDLEGVQGAIVGALTSYPFGPQVWAREVFFWVDPEVRAGCAKPLIEAFEAWAREQKAVVIGMSCTADGRTQKLFERLGFVAMETNMIKAV